MRSFYLKSRLPNLLKSPLVQFEEEQEVEEQAKQKHEQEKAKLCCVFDLDKTEMRPEAGFTVFCHETINGVVPVNRTWMAKIAGACDLAIFISKEREAQQEAIQEAKEAARLRSGPPPMFFLGKYLPTDLEALVALAGLCQGIVLEAPPADDPELAAEHLRRAISVLPEYLTVETGAWPYAPIICITGPLDVIASVPKTVLEYTLLFSEPSHERRPGGKLLVSCDSEVRPWWATEYFTFGPDALSWRPWARGLTL